MSEIPNPITPDVAKFIRKKAQQLRRHAGFRGSDRADIEQDLILFALQQLRDREQPPDNPDAFITTLVERHAATLVRRQKRAKRQDSLRPGVLSLQELAPDEDGVLVEQGLLITEEQNLARRGGGWTSPFEHVDRADQVEAALRRMPARYRDLCERLMTGSVAEVARDLGVRPAAVFNKLARVRRYFEEFAPDLAKSRDGSAKKSVG